MPVSMPAPCAAPRYAPCMELGPETLRSISHDMRNLLTAVRGHAELALRGLSPGDPAREDVAHCRRRDGGRSSISSTSSTASDRSPTARSRSTWTAPSTPCVASSTRCCRHRSRCAWSPIRRAPTCTISKLRVERIILNLVLNARDAMDDGGVLTRHDHARAAEDIAQIVVADTGPGFSRRGPRAPLRGRLHDQARARRQRPRPLGLTVFVGGAGGTHRGRLAAGRGCHHRRHPAGGRPRGHAAGGDLTSVRVASQP